MAVLEALTGQIFLVVTVARLVALFTPCKGAPGLPCGKAQARGTDLQEAAVAEDDPAADNPDTGRESIDPMRQTDAENGFEP